MDRFSTLALAALLLAGCSASDPKPVSFASSVSGAPQAAEAQGFALPPPAAPQPLPQQQLAQPEASSTGSADRNLAGMPNDSTAFPTAPTAPAASNCRTVGAVTTCDAAPNPYDAHYTN